MEGCEKNKFKIKEGQEAAYEELKEINSHDGMGIAIMQYAEKWGSMMEEKIASGKTVEGNLKLDCGNTDTEDYIGMNITAYCKYDTDDGEWTILYSEPNDKKNDVTYSGNSLPKT